MATISRLQKYSLISLGTIGGALTYYTFNAPKNVKKFDAQNASILTTSPNTTWNRNWDLREPRSIISVKGEDGKNEKLNFVEKPKVNRHIILIRHGQYCQGKTDEDRYLTALGRQQAELTGQRLAKLGIKFDYLVKSTQTRAQETGNIIAKHLPSDIKVKNCQLLEEGVPVKYDSASSDLNSELNLFRDSPRIEAAFRKYFYRAHPEQTEDSYTLLVCHSNVIRFFVCKALQFPPEGWIRLSLNHGSITWVSIKPSGFVTVRAFGDTGFMDRKHITKK